MNIGHRLSDYIIEPFLHFEGAQIYNPVTNKRVHKGDHLFNVLGLYKFEKTIKLDEDSINLLKSEGWVIKKNLDILSRFYLKAITLEGNAHCNQRCNFCPVSLDPKPVHTMSLGMYEDIVVQLAEFSNTIEGVFMINYNEPTVDKYFIERVAILKKYNLPICINTNGSGLTPRKVDQLLALGSLRFLSINLSTLDEAAYNKERGYTGLDRIIQNIDYASRFSLAEKMTIAVLGHNDTTHHKNFKSIKARYIATHFEVESFRIMDRAGNINVGQHPVQPISNLRGCNNLGSRTLQHLHINAFGECVMCCEDYYEKYKVGDLKTQSVNEVLAGEKMKELRAMSYGLTEAPQDFICRKCVFALSCDKSK